MQAIEVIRELEIFLLEREDALRDTPMTDSGSYMAYSDSVQYRMDQAREKFAESLERYVNTRIQAKLKNWGDRDR